MLTFDVNLSALEAQLDAVVTKAQKAARLGAKAGSQIYYDAVKATTPVSKAGHWFQGSSAKKAKGAAATRAASYWFDSGSLKGAVYQVFRKESTLDHPEYQIAWNHRKVPYGFMVTGGTKQGAKANPFVQKGSNNAVSKATAAMLAEFNKVMAQ